MGAFIVTALAGEAFAATVVGSAIAFAINMVASSIISKIFAPDAPNQSNSNGLPNPGNRQQIPPAGDNKLPVVYGSAWVGGVITDMSISSDNQDIYWVLALSEVTNSENGSTPDNFTFGGIYWGGKKCVFDATNKYKVIGLLDESTNTTDTTVAGNMEVFLYKNGSNQPYNSSQTAISVLSASNLIYKWDATKLMSNCAFAIVHIKYNQAANLTGLQQTRFQVINPRNAPGDCIYDYLKSERYGAAIDATYIDNATITALNTYSNQNFTYTTYSGGTSTQKRFQFNGALDTNLKIMQNIQNMADCCDCLIKYNEITGKWGVIVQTPTVTPAMALNDSNIVSAITVTPIDLSNSFNICEVKFPDGGAKDSFNSATFDLATINPALLYANEPVNKQSLSLYFVNNSITAQYLANRFLEGAREDLQIQLEIDYTGIQLEAGDVITLTNVNYGWNNKQFRIMKVIEKFNDSGAITASLNLMEFNPAVYDDKSITEFKPVDNSGLSDLAVFGIIPAPTITNITTTGYKPKFDVIINTPSIGLIQYAELWYSTVSNPTQSQLIFAGSIDKKTDGSAYPINSALTAIEVAGLSIGNYYFFSRFGNTVKTSAFSPAAIIAWNTNFIDDVIYISANGTTLSWTAVSNYKLAGYKLRYQYGSSTDWNSAIPLFDGVLTETTFDATTLPTSILNVMVKAVDTDGHESKNAASVGLNTSDTLIANVVETIDFKALGWPGNLTNCSIVGGNLVADANNSFYGADDQSFYDLDASSFYEAIGVYPMTYTTTPILLNKALAGSSGVLNSATFGNNVVVEYRLVNDSPFYGPDGDSKYGADASSFYGIDNDFVPMPSSLVIKNDYYQFRISIGTGTQGEVDEFNFVIDAPDIVEFIPNHVMTGGAIPYTKAFTSIKVIQATLQNNSLGVVTLQINKTVNLAPTITGYNSSQVATSGAKCDITLQGY